jgi:hypothetical protein
MTPVARGTAWVGLADGTLLEVVAADDVERSTVRLAVIARHAIGCHLLKRRGFKVCWMTGPDRYCSPRS